MFCRKQNKVSERRKFAKKKQIGSSADIMQKVENFLTTTGSSKRGAFSICLLPCIRITTVLWCLQSWKKNLWQTKHHSEPSLSNDQLWNVTISKDFYNFQPQPSLMLLWNGPWRWMAGRLTTPWRHLACHCYCHGMRTLALHCSPVTKGGKNM